MTTMMMSLKVGSLRLVLLTSIVLGITGSADAGLIVVSGDTNITSALIGDGTTINAGNQRLFQNILGSGTRVLIKDGNSGTTAPATDTNTYYNSLSGVSSSFTSGAITSAALSGVNLLVSILPSNGYTTSEIQAISAFSSAGGSLFLIGEFGSFDSGSTTGINALLTSLGSGMRLNSDFYDAGYQTTSGSHILANPLTTGVTSFTYAAAGSISGGSGLVTVSSGQVFIAAEMSGVPEPASLALTGIALLIGLAGQKLRRTRAG